MQLEQYLHDPVADLIILVFLVLGITGYFIIMPIVVSILANLAKVIERKTANKETGNNASVPQKDN